ncbi:MAG: class I SAM-dependent methyltransferase [Campylobacteraceae bacterium]|nr:class I SAM-dependent methyltransferase [Campylobacteraceae bacterium]
MENLKEIAHLEQINSFYEKGDYIDELMIDREIELIKKSINNYKDALEIGCGNGYSTERLHKLFNEFEVVEPSKKNINLLKKRINTIKCHENLLETFENKKKYENIFFLNVIEHVEDPIESLKSLTKMIKHDGLIFISAPNCMSLNRRAGYKMGLLDNYEAFAPKDYEVGHRRLYTVDMMRDHCEQAGLKILNIKGVYLKALSETQMFSLGDDAIKAFMSLGEDVPQYCAGLLAVATKKYY